MRTIGTVKGKPPAKKLWTMRGGTRRAHLLQAMSRPQGVQLWVNGMHTKLYSWDRHQVLSAARSIWVKTGVGYELTARGRLRALYPPGKGYRDVIKSRA